MKFRATYLATAAILASTAFAAPGAQAGYMVTLEEVGQSVVATGSGAIDVTGLTLVHGFVVPRLYSPGGYISIGGSDGLAEFSDIYTSNVASGTFIAGPASFGSDGPPSDSLNNIGNPVGIYGIAPELLLPAGYVSDSALSDTATFGGTFKQLGVTPGRYDWTWGIGANQNFTLLTFRPIPEPSTWAMMLIGFAGLGYAYCRASCKSAALAA